MTALRVCISRIGFAAPGFDSWAALQAAFPKAAFEGGGELIPRPSCLPPRAMRRFSPQILLALALAEQIGPALPKDAGWVFASSIGEGETLQVILEALRDPGMLVQPVRFQNSVHNAPSGQWTIAAGLHGPTTSLGAYDETVAAGLLKAAMQVVLEQRSVGLVLYDVPLPVPLDAVHPLGIPVGAAFAMTPQPSPDTVAILDLAVEAAPQSSAHTHLAQSMIASGNPIASILPLLERLAGHGDGRVVIRHHGGGGISLTVGSP